MTTPGIEYLSFFAPHTYVGLNALAEHYGIDPEKYSKGIGQEKIALPGPDEDIVTMAAEATQPILDRAGAEGIDTVLFATETGIDQSKAASIYLHRLLGLSPNCRCVELKQACYSATAALQMACSYVARKPDRKVLVIASDVARYDLGSSGEATQGAGAVAMLVSASPKVAEIGAVSGLFTEDVMDFWRPNHRRTPLFDGKASTLRYLNALVEAWKDYQAGGGLAYEDFSHFCYHIPFSRMGEKANSRLAKANGAALDPDKIMPGLVYNRQVGNCYTASLYLAMISVLENGQGDQAGNAIGLFSYGSGATGEFFDARVLPGYGAHLFQDRHLDLLQNREAVSYDDYVALWQETDLSQGTPDRAKGRFRLTGTESDKRIYVDREA
ncbi:MAG: hydroxymethylglutaryl-CoA synthase [Pseudomonadota bacterium]